ncbi:hypothetical protein [Sphingorhabdus sp.]|uniref:hypothetical protein n=1 Tax=Sphingorhabdus sp. TaxID=1902408 RepID=UPI003593B6BD
MSIFRIFSPKLVLAALKRIPKLDLIWNALRVFWKAANHQGSIDLHTSLDLWQAGNGTVGQLVTEVGAEFAMWLIVEFFQPDCIVACIFLALGKLHERLEGRGQRKSNILPMDDN